RRRTWPGEGGPAAEEAGGLHDRFRNAGRFGAPEGAYEVLFPPRNAPIRPGRELAESLRLAELVPVSDAGEEIGPLDVPGLGRVGSVALVLDRHSERPCEADRIEDVPAIAHAAVAGAPALPARLAEPRARARPESPGVVEVVLGAGSLQARDLLAID